MDFKNYVKLMLEAEKAEDQDKDEAEDQDEEDEDSDDNEDKEASVKTGRNGCEASTDTDEDEDSDKDEEKDSDKDEEKKASCCTKKSLKESIIYSSRYACGTLNESVMSEETRVMVEGINNNSASKYLAKLAKRADKEYAKYTKKGAKQAADAAKKAASSLKEASAKLYKCETRYQIGDVSAKKEYKQICKQYSKELKEMGKGIKGFRNLIFTLLAGVVLLGGIGITAAANEDVIEQLNTGFQYKEKMPEILKKLAVNDKKAVTDLLNNVKNGSYEDVGGAITDAEPGEAIKRLGRNVKEVAEKTKESLEKTDKYAKEYNTWGGEFGTKADWEAEREGYKDAKERERYEGWAKKLGKGTREVGDKIAKGIKGAGSGIAKGVTGAAKGLGKGFSGK